MNAVSAPSITSSLYPWHRRTPHDPVLSPDVLQAIAAEILHLSMASTTTVVLDHVATGVTRVARGQVRLNTSGDRLRITLQSQFGHRASAVMEVNQIDSASLREAVTYLDRVARDQPGDPVDTAMPVSPRHYGPSTVWHESTAAAFDGARHDIIEPLIAPVSAAHFRVSAFVGVCLHSQCIADKTGLSVAGQETDSELTVTAWNADGKGSGWAGQAARDWATLRPEQVTNDVIRLTTLAANPVAFEPGRRTVILDRPAVAQIVAGMGGAFDAQTTLGGRGPMFDRAAGRPRLGLRVVDSRVMLSSDPNDADGGYLPFNAQGYPLVPMAWVGPEGVLQHLAYQTFFAASQGVTPANDAPASLRLGAAPTTKTMTVAEMIASCQEGIYVNRFSQLQGFDGQSGAVTGVTNGGCFLIRNGKIDKAVRDFRFVESPWFFLNRLVAIGTTQRTALGYAPWHGAWPIAPTIVPPMMLHDFNFVALADAV